LNLSGRYKYLPGGAGKTPEPLPPEGSQELLDIQASESLAFDTYGASQVFSHYDWTLPEQDTGEGEGKASDSKGKAKSGKGSSKENPKVMVLHQCYTETAP
jgi:hypothetical protein